MTKNWEEVPLFALDEVPTPKAPARVNPGTYRKPVAFKMVRMPWQSAVWLRDESQAQGVTISTFLAQLVAEAMENRVWASNPHKGGGR